MKIELDDDIIEVVETRPASTFPKKIKGLCCGVSVFDNLYQPMDYVFECQNCGKNHVCHSRTMNMIRSKISQSRVKQTQGGS